jgi:hypothetical protein
MSFVYNLCVTNMLSHARPPAPTVAKVRELAPDESAYRSDH